MFSESWHRVATHRAWLRSSVEAHKNTFRGEPWYILHDPFSNQFYRLSPAAYRFAARLSPKKTIEQVWQECMALDVIDAPGQEEVIRLLAQLTQSNLISSDLPPDSAMLFERFQKTQQRERRGKLANFLFLKLPLFDPHRILTHGLRLLSPFLGRVGIALFALVILWACKIVLENWDELFHQSQGLLAPENLTALYVCGFFVKAWHEMGHGVLCRFFGGEVRTCGVMLLIMTPLPYVDVTSSWAFRSKWQRALVGSGGIIFELFLAAIATFVWSHTGRGVINSLAYNVMVLASVTTLAFNANPLLRFDGYYIFSDIMGLPNLGQRSFLQLRYLLERHIFGCVHSTSPAHSSREAKWLAAYAITSGIYRTFLIGVIVLVIAGHFFGVGLILAMFCLSMWIISPIWKFFRYLFTDPALQRRRAHSIRLTFGCLATVLAFLLFVPMPRYFRALGLIEAEHYSIIHAKTAGSVESIITPSGTLVEAGQPLIRLTNPYVDLRIDAARMQMRQVQTKQNMAETEARAVLQFVHGEKATAEQAVTALLKDKEGLVITAPHRGIWVCTSESDLMGTWADRGAKMGEVFDPALYEFTAVVPQQEASNLFGNGVQKAEIFIKGQAGLGLKVLKEKVIPNKQDILPSAALGWRGGGPIEVTTDEAEGVRAVEPFFKVHLTLEQREDVMLAQRRTGMVRFKLKSEPYFWQWTRHLRQVLQDKLKL